MDGNHPLPPQSLSFPKTHPIKILRDLFCSELSKNPVIMSLGMYQGGAFKEYLGGCWTKLKQAMSMWIF